MKIKTLFKQHNTSANPVCRPYVIAEAGVNHEGDLNLAKRLIEEAKEGGADAVKFQTYKAQTLASRYSPAYWDTNKETARNQYELFKRYDKFWKTEYEDLKKYCDEVDIEFLSTPFDFDAAHFLNDLMDAFKISSSDITNKPLIEYICSFRKPIILSTGAADLHEIKDAVSWIDDYQLPLALLHCVLNYPTQNKDANLGMIIDLKRNFQDKIIGYSDHTLPNNMKVLEIATLLGCSIIEKHFTYDKTLPGNDHYHAMDKNDLKLFRTNIDNVLQIVGSFQKTCLVAEELSKKFARRSLVAARAIPKGSLLSVQDITFKRPGTGISPKDLDSALGKKTVEDLKEDQIINWSLLE